MTGPRAAAAFALALAACRGATGGTGHGSPAPSSVSPRRDPAPAAAASAPAPAPDGLRELTWRYEDSPLGPSEVVVLVPNDATPVHPAPVLIAFHGRGESLRGPSLGARGFIDDYRLGAAVRRLHAPPLAAADLLGFVTARRLAALNGALREAPYRGLVVVCPFLPDVLHGEKAVKDGEALAAFVVDQLLPRVARETPALANPETTAVDGVSLGGRAALLVGFLRSEAFRVVSALQPAIDLGEITLFAGLAEKARKKNPALSLRLLTSDGDYFLEPTETFSKVLGSRGVENRLDVVSGPHSYDFNRGPGVYEMLLFHDRALHGLAPLPTSMP